MHLIACMHDDLHCMLCVNSVSGENLAEDSEWWMCGLVADLGVRGGGGWGGFLGGSGGGWEVGVGDTCASINVSWLSWNFRNVVFISVERLVFGTFLIFYKMRVWDVLEFTHARE